MNLQYACAVVGTAIAVLSWLFGGSLVEQNGEVNMIRLLFALAMGCSFYFACNFVFDMIAAIREFKERRAILEEIKHNQLFLKILRTLYQKRYFVPKEEWDYCNYLVEIGLAKCFGMDAIVLSAAGLKFCRKLAENDFQHV